MHKKNTLNYLSFQRRCYPIYHQSIKSEKLTTFQSFSVFFFNSSNNYQTFTFNCSTTFQSNNKIKKMTKKSEIRVISQIWLYYANLIGYARFFMLVLASFCILTYPHLASLSIFFSLVLDWIDGPVARKYNQCSIFGHFLDWIMDIGGQLIVFMWWGHLNPQVIPFVFILVLTTMTTMIVDVIMTVSNCLPKMQYAKQSKILDFSLRFGMSMEVTGYKTIGLGNIAYLNYALWSISGCLSYLYEGQSINFWDYCFWANVPLAALQFIMESAYLVECLRQWGQKIVKTQSNTFTQIINIRYLQQKTINKKVDNPQQQQTSLKSSK